MRQLVPFAVAAVILTGLLVGLTPIHWLPAWLVGAGLATFAAYGWDKRRAENDGWRLRKSVLHALSLGGGVLGGWAGRAYFDHKTRQPVFGVVLVIATVLWILIAALVYT